MSDVRLCKTAVMEIRPRLQSVNVFLILRKSGPASVKLDVDSFEVTVGSSSQKVDCGGDFRIVPHSLSCLTREGDSVTFRFSTENVQPRMGTAAFEFVEFKEIDRRLDDAECFLKTDRTYDINCANCLRSFRKSTVFERVLPLPENADTSDWFCHGGDCAIGALTPKLNDAFFSTCFVHLSGDLLGGILRDDACLFCSRCLAWTGTVSKGDIFRVWFNTVAFVAEHDELKTCPLEDCFKVVRQIANGPLNSAVRIVLNCRTSSSQNDVVLLSVMEKKLRVSFEESDGKARAADVAKVLFKYEDARSDLARRWTDDLNAVNVVDVSKRMMVGLLDHLYEMNRYIPKNFGISNDFYISYLMYDNK